MRPWTFPVALDPDSPEPLFLQIAQAISRDIQRGRIAPGATLPGSRTLAQNLGVHRNTVLAAYRELGAEGWIRNAGRTTCVVSEFPAATQPGEPCSAAPGYDLPAPPDPEKMLNSIRHGLSSLPDPRLLPIREIGQALRRALGKRELLGYGDSRGNAQLRAGLARLLSEMRGLANNPDQILVTGGTQMALTLIARTLLRPGDRVVVEDPGYPAAWAAFQDAGARLIPVAVDGEGLRVDLLAAVLREHPVRALFVTPHHQFPTTVTMSASRRIRLLELAAAHRMAIIEDDYDFEFHYGGYPVMPLASRDPSGVVIYVGTLSKVLAPGFRLGFVSGPPSLVNAMALNRRIMDHHGNQIMEQAVADLLNEGLLQRHVRKMRRVYARRLEALADALRQDLPDVASFELPSGGMSIWVTFREGIDVEAWLGRARKDGIRNSPGRKFDFQEKPLQGLRLGFSNMNEQELRQAVRILANTLPR
jgi:GntR family transcriptional regulator/MocR family aminotransferase